MTSSTAIIAPFSISCPIDIKTNGEECPICYEPFQNEVQVLSHSGQGLTHLFHLKCITSYARIHTGLNKPKYVSCPLCRENVDISSVYGSNLSNCMKISNCALTAINTGLLTCATCSVKEIVMTCPEMPNELIIGCAVAAIVKGGQLIKTLSDKGYCIKPLIWGVLVGFVTNFTCRANRVPMNEAICIASLVSTGVSGIFKAFKTSWLS